MNICFKRYERPEHLTDENKNYFGTVIIFLMFKSEIPKFLIKDINKLVNDFMIKYQNGEYKIQEIENDINRKIIVDYGVNVFADKIYIILNFLPKTHEEFIEKLKYCNRFYFDFKNILENYKDIIDINIEVKNEDYVNIVKESFEKPLD